MRSRAISALLVVVLMLVLTGQTVWMRSTAASAPGTPAHHRLDHVGGPPAPSVEPTPQPAPEPTPSPPPQPTVPPVPSRTPPPLLPLANPYCGQIPMIVGFPMGRPHINPFAVFSIPWWLKCKLLGN